jgi:large subunit ribosomal protein L17
MGTRHQVSGRQLGRNSGQRRALYRSLLNALVEHDRIRTTEAKAKEIQPMLEKLITLGRTDTVTNRRTALTILAKPASVTRLFEDIGPRFAARAGGYTRIFKINVRPGDGAVVCQIEMVE